MYVCMYVCIQSGLQAVVYTVHVCIESNKFMNRLVLVKSQKMNYIVA